MGRVKRIGSSGLGPHPTALQLRGERFLLKPRLALRSFTRLLIDIIFEDNLEGF